MVTFFAAAKSFDLLYIWYIWQLCMKCEKLDSKDEFSIEICFSPDLPLDSHGGFSSDYKRFIEELNSLLDKVMLRNQWHIRVHQHHLMFKGHRWAPHKTIYGYQKKVCLDKTFPLGHFMLHFIIFLICQMTTKASNVLNDEILTEFRSHAFEPAFVSQL